MNIRLLQVSVFIATILLFVFGIIIIVNSDNLIIDILIAFSMSLSSSISMWSLFSK